MKLPSGHPGYILHTQPKNFVHVDNYQVGCLNVWLIAAISHEPIQTLTIRRALEKSYINPTFRTTLILQTKINMQVLDICQ